MHFYGLRLLVSGRLECLGNLCQRIRVGYELCNIDFARLYEIDARLKVSCIAAVSVAVRAGEYDFSYLLK